MSVPFHYTAGQRTAIRALLPFSPPPSASIWDTFPYRLPAFIASGDGQTRDENWAFTMLENVGGTVFDLDNEFHRTARGRVAYEDVIRATPSYQVRLIAAGMVAENQLVSEIAARAEALSREQHPKRPTRADPVRDWYLEKLLYVWEQCGGETHASANDASGGPLVRFLRLASSPIFAKSSRKPLTAYAARGAVRKLLGERRRRSP